MQFENLPQHKFFEEISKYNINFNLSSASANTPILEKFLDTKELLHFIKNTPINYSEIIGGHNLREQISHNLYSKINVQQLMVFSGAGEAIFSTYSALLEKNDEVIVITPNYQSLQHYIKDLNINFIELELTLDINSNQKWSLDLNQLEALITNKTKLIAINFPHNPTGAHLTLAEVESLVEIAREHDLFILSDEVSSFSVYQKNQFWCLAELYEKAISISVMSKSFGLSGIRIAWAITQNKDVLNKLKTIKTHLSICSSTVDEYLCQKILPFSNEIILDNNTIILNNLKNISNILDSSQFLSPQAGIVSLVKCHRNIDDIVNELLKIGLVILPLKLFYNNKNKKASFFRLGLGNINLEKNVLMAADLIRSK